MINYFTKKYLLYFIINFVFLLLLFLESNQGTNIFFISTIVLYFVYLIFMNEKIVITNMIIFLLLYNIVFTILWVSRPVMVPLGAKYIIDLANLLLVLKILINPHKYGRCIKDKIFLLSLAFIVLSFIFVIFDQKDNLINYLMCLRIYLRFLPVYLILSVDFFYKKYDLYLFYAINGIMLLIEVFLHNFKKFGQDDLSGVFGVSNVQALLLLMMIVYGCALALYFYRKISLSTLVSIIIGLFIVSGLAEIKMFFFTAPIVTILFGILRVKNLFKLMKIGVPLIVMMIVGINILTNTSPQFKNFFNPSRIYQNIYNYTMYSNDPRYSMGRLENIQYTNDNLLQTPGAKIEGLGIGYGMPDENWYFATHNINNTRTITSLYNTPIYDLLGTNSGYQFSSMNILYIETGAIGLIIFYLGVLVFLYRCVKLIKSKSMNSKIIAWSIMAFLISFLPLMFYYPYLLDINVSLMLATAMGLAKYRTNPAKIDEFANETSQPIKRIFPKIVWSK